MNKKLILMTKKLLIGFAFLFSPTAWLAFGDEPLAAGFREPPRSDAPYITLSWFNGNETKESITKNLEALAAANPGGILLFSYGFEAQPEGPVVFMSDQWKELLVHAVREAKRLGMPFGMNLVEGGNGMGGPWIKPEESMHALVWSRTQLDGPFQGTIDLPQAFTRFGYYHDVAVLAVPRSAPWATAMRKAQPAVTAKTWNYKGTEEVFGPNGLGAPKQFAGERLFDGLPQTTTVIEGANGNYVQMDFSTPFEAAGLFVYPLKTLPDFTYELQALQGGKYVPIASFRPEKFANPVRLTFEPATSKSFRLVLTGKTKKAGVVMFSEVELLGPGERASADYLLPGGVFKAGLVSPAGHWGQFNAYATATKGKEIPLSSVLNLTGKMDAKGRLTVSLPEGSWTIYRFGYTSTGSTGHWQTSGTGLEVDRFRPEGVEAQFERMVDPLLKAIGPEAADNWKYTHIEGWELGNPNWTPGFEKAFAERRGYDPTPYLPILAGEQIGGPEISERFLWDFRRTIGDLFSQVFYRRWRELAHERRMQTRVQAVSSHQIWDLPQAAQECDFPATAALFNWRSGGKDKGKEWNLFGGAKEVAAASLLNENPAAACMLWPRAGYLYSPRDFKAAGDLALAAGYTQIITSGRAPGVPGEGPDAFVHPFQTWWTNAGKAWNANVQRCLYLLRQGIPVADVLLFSGDGVPDGATLLAEIPEGYRTGLVSRDVLAELKVEDGLIVAPSGVRFRFLVLPAQERMTVETLEQIEKLAKAGATVLGPRPKHTPGLGNYPESEKRLQSLADALWGRSKEASGVNKVGSGRVVWGKTPAEWLAGEQVPPDFSAGGAKDSVLFTHRRTEDADIYFLSNQQDQDVDFDGAFRVAGRSAELWNPDTGEITPVGVAQEKNGVTHIPLRLGPFGSLFVVFREAKDAAQPAAALEFESRPVPVALAGEVEKMPAGVLRDGGAGNWKLEGWQNGNYTIRQTGGRAQSVNISALPAAQELGGPWQVRFPQGSGAPQEAEFSELISWPEAEEPGIQNFSGTAEYEVRFTVPEDWLGTDRSVMLDLGRVEQVAEVSLNGGKWTTLWKPPYRFPVTSELRAGENTLKVRVTNVWKNRLVGDAKLPEEQRIAKTPYQPYKGDEPLLPAGLLGPVKLVPGKIESLQ